jgi:Carbohydrate family 9 binding domain-like
MRLFFVCTLLLVSGACGLELVGAAVRPREAQDGAIMDRSAAPDGVDSGAPSDSQSTWTDSSPGLLPEDPGAPSCTGNLDGGLNIAHRGAASVAVDGKANDWAVQTQFNTIHIPARITSGSEPPFCADFTASWDEDALNFYFRVADKNQPDSIPERPYVNDAIELFLGGVPPTDPDGLYRISDQQIGVDHASRGFRKRRLSPTELSVGLFNATAEINYQAVKFPWGYAVELRVLRTEIGQQADLTAGMQVPMTAAFDDGRRSPEGKEYYLWRATPSDFECTARGRDSGVCCRNPTNSLDTYEPFCNTRLWKTATLMP